MPKRLDKARALGSTTASAVAELVAEAPSRNGSTRKGAEPEAAGALVRIGVSLPQRLMDQVRDAQFTLRRARRPVSVSAFIESAVREMLAHPDTIRAVIDRHNARPRRESSR